MKIVSKSQMYNIMTIMNNYNPMKHWKKRLYIISRFMNNWLK